MKRRQGSKTKNTNSNGIIEVTNVNTSNTPYLVIVESPSKCGKIEKFLGFQYKCIASKGHLREVLKVHSFKENYRIDFKLIKEKETHAQWMKKIVSQFDPKYVFLGTDDDREGEAIAWHICEICHLNIQSTKRILFHEVTAPALKRAIANPITIRMNIVKAQHTRQVLDRIIGFQISPILSRLLVHDNSKFLSAGRCQTPTLRLVYDRHKEFENRKEKIQYKIKAEFLSHPSILDATLETYIDMEEVVCEFLELSKSHPHILTLKETNRRMTPPSKPFSTSHLLQSASAHLNMSPNHVMDVCQKLYQDGKITYMRTESMQYAKGFIQQAKTYIGETFGDPYIGEDSDLEKITNMDNKNPHEAIRVTSVEVTKTDYTDKKTNALYGLIWRRCMESCMKPYIYDDTELYISAPLSKRYKSSVQVSIDLGWKRITTNIEEMKANQHKMSMKLEFFKRFRNKSIAFQKIDAVLFMVDTETFFQESSIIQKLEHLGIGRPSTYSMLVDTIQERKYVLKQDIEGETFSGKEYLLDGNHQVESKLVEKTFGSSKNKIRIQELGVQAIEILMHYFEPLFNYSYTKKMEDELDELVHNPAKSVIEMCKNCEDMIKQYTKPLQDKMKKTYHIDEQHVLIFGKSGLMIKAFSEDGSSQSYKQLKNHLKIDFEKLENNKYTLEDLVELSNDCLGIYETHHLYLKNGPFGAYVTWGESKLSIANESKGKTASQITFDMAIDWINKSKIKANQKSKIVRIVDSDSSLRKGKYGNYVYYKTEDMKTPTFINIKKCPHDFINDPSEILSKWIQETLKK